MCFDSKIPFVILPRSSSLLKGQDRPLSVVHLPAILPEIELVQVSVQVNAAHVVEGPDNAAFEKREVRFRKVCMNDPANVFPVVIDHAT